MGFYNMQECLIPSTDEAETNVFTYFVMQTAMADVMYVLNNKSNLDLKFSTWVFSWKQKLPRERNYNFLSRYEVL
jgi:hypothetical protein